MPGIDFNRLRNEITMERVLAQLNFQPTQRTGNHCTDPVRCMAPSPQRVAPCQSTWTRDATTATNVAATEINWSFGRPPTEFPSTKPRATSAACSVTTAPGSTVGDRENFALPNRNRREEAPVLHRLRTIVMFCSRFTSSSSLQDSSATLILFVRAMPFLGVCRIAFPSGKTDSSRRMENLCFSRQNANTSFSVAS